MTNKQKNFVSAVVYIRETGNMADVFLSKIYGILNENFEKFEIICVNDTPLNLKEEVKNISSDFSNCTLSIINMGYYQGLEMSMNAGVDLAIGDFVFEFDNTQMDYDDSLIMQTYNRSLQGYDIVACGKGNTKIASKLFYSIYNHNSGAQYQLKSETFRIISRRAINRVHSMSVNLPYRKALYANCGLKMDYIRYEALSYLIEGKRVIKAPHETAVTTLILFTNIAYKLTLIFTFLMMLITLGTTVYVVAVYFTGNPVAGYTTTMFFMSVTFFVLFMVLSVVIKYLSLILGMVFSKQKYIVESIEKITG